MRLVRGSKSTVIATVHSLLLSLKSPSGSKCNPGECTNFITSCPSPAAAGIMLPSMMKNSNNCKIAPPAPTAGFPEPGSADCGRLRRFLGLTPPVTLRVVPAYMGLPRNWDVTVHLRLSNSAVIRKIMKLHHSRQPPCTCPGVSINDELPAGVRPVSAVRSSAFRKALFCVERAKHLDHVLIPGFRSPAEERPFLCISARLRQQLDDAMKRPGFTGVVLRRPVRPSKWNLVPVVYRKYFSDPLTLRFLLHEYPPQNGRPHPSFVRRVRDWRGTAPVAASALWRTRSDREGTDDIFNLHLLFGDEPAPQPCHVPLVLPDNVFCRLHEGQPCEICRNPLREAPGYFYVDGTWRTHLGDHEYGPAVPEHQLYYHAYVN